MSQGCENMFFKFFYSVICATPFLVRDVRLKLAIFLWYLLDQTHADLCTRLADCVCDDPSHLLCSGNSMISIDILKDIAVAGYVLSIDLRGRLFSSLLILELGDVFPRLEEIRVEGCDCSKILPYLHLVKFRVIHSCSEVITSSIPQSMLFSSTTSTGTTTSRQSTSPSWTDLITSHAIHTSTDTVTTRPSGDIVPVVIPSAHPDHIVVVHRYSAEEYVSFTIPPVVIVIIGSLLITCCVRLSRGQSFLCINGRPADSGDNQGVDAIENSGQGERVVYKSETGGGSPTVNIVSEYKPSDVKSASASHTKKADADSSQTYVMKPFSSCEAKGREFSRVSSGESYSYGEDSHTVVQVTSDSPNPLPLTSTPARKDKVASLASCFAPVGSPPYKPMSPASPSDSVNSSVYQTPMGESSSAPLVGDKNRQRKKKSPSFWANLLGKRQNLRNDEKKEVNAAGLPPKTRISQKTYARSDALDNVELSASMIETKNPRGNTSVSKVSSV